MGVEWMSFCLRGYGGPESTGTTFFETIGVYPWDGFTLHPSDTSWQAAIIDLLHVNIEDCRSAAEATEEFAARIDAGLLRIAAWLEQLETERFDRWRASGKKADVFARGWIDENRFDLTLPPPFLFQCGRLGLTLDICSNY